MLIISQHWGVCGGEGDEDRQIPGGYLDVHPNLNGKFLVLVKNPVKYNKTKTNQLNNNNNKNPKQNKTNQVHAPEEQCPRLTSGNTSIPLLPY